MAPLVEPGEWGNYSKTSPPENVDTALAAASGAIRRVCGWSISRESLEFQELDTWGTVLVSLATMRLVSIESLTVCGEAQTEGTDFIKSSRGVIRRLGGLLWPFGYGDVVVSYTHGFLPDEMPEEVKMLCVSLARRVDAVPAGVLSQAVGGINIQYGDRNATISLSEAEREVLGPWMLEPGRKR